MCVLIADGEESLQNDLDYILFSTRVLWRISFSVVCLLSLCCNTFVLWSCFWCVLSIVTVQISSPRLTPSLPNHLLSLCDHVLCSFFLFLTLSYSLCLCVQLPYVLPPLCSLSPYVLIPITLSFPLLFLYPLFSVLNILLTSTFSSYGVLSLLYTPVTSAFFSSCSSLVRSPAPYVSTPYASPPF